MKLSSLDSSHWQCAPANIASHRAFLESHKIHGQYHVHGLTLHCPPDIYHPGEFGSTRFMLKGLFTQLPQWGRKVLEIGAGSGAIGLCLAAAGREVTMLDIDPAAVDCARANAQRNELQATVAQSDLFSAVAGKRYDLILFNAPLMDKPAEEPLEHITCDEGGALLQRFMREAQAHLAPGGYICVSVSNIGSRESIINALAPYNETIVYAEFYGGNNEWRWLVSAQPKAQ